MTIRAMYSGVSGLKSHQDRMDVIGNNIANVNTVGFKAGRVTFSDVFNQTIRSWTPGTGETGSVNPMQVGLGVKLMSVDNIFTQGGIESTGRLFDLAIAGNGFFALTDQASSGTGQIYLTRAGNFNIDQNGYLVNPGTGFAVLGRMADATGAISDAGSVQAIRIDPSQTVSASATRNVVLNGNLDTQSTPKAASTLGDIRALFDQDGLPLNLQIGDTIQITGGTVDGSAAAGTSIITIEAGTTLGDVLEAVSTAINSVAGSGAEAALDSDGHLQLIAGTVDIADLTVGLVSGANPAREAEATLRLASLFDDGAGAAGMSAVSGGANATSVGWFREADATVSVDVFDSKGAPQNISISFVRDTSATTPNNTAHYQVIVPHVDGNSPNGSFATGTTGTLVFNSDGTLDVASTGAILPLTFDPDGSSPANGGVDALTINLDLAAVTQYYAPNTVVVGSQDGIAQGELDSVIIDNNGVIRGVFTNGVTRDLAQVMLATVTNEEGLERSGESTFLANSASGLAMFGRANESGRGSIQSGALELSNVDLATEFTDLIITQRGFQANARVITAGDEIMRDTVNLI
jgi:flagellar hook protein FlgE